MFKKISWKFRKTHISITPLTILINERWYGWGFDIFNISHNLWEGSLLKMTWILPNGAERKFSFSGDFIFLRQYLLKQLSNISDRMLWGTATTWDVNKYYVLKFIFK
jgi:hypothetical protein